MGFTTGSLIKNHLVLAGGGYGLVTLGRVQPVSDYIVFQEHVQRGEPLAGGSPLNCAPLSTSHIRPFVEYRAGAGILKAHRGGLKDQDIIRGVRGDIKGFSNASRRRLMQLIAGIRFDADLPLFITLTYPNSFPDAVSSKRHLKMFFQRLERYLLSQGIILYGLVWKLEPQKRGAPHYHMMLWGCELPVLAVWLPGAWYDIAGNGDKNHLAWHSGELGNQHCVQQVLSREGVMRYASKYLGKTFEVEGWQNVGRYWGVVKRSNIPFGELVVEEVTRKKAVEVMRYQRRFAGLKGSSKKSSTIFCDADQWVEKLQIGE